MIDFGYDFIREIFDNAVNKADLKWFNLSYKALAVSFFLISVYTNILSQKWDWAQAKLPFDKNKLLTSFGVVLLIVFYDKVLGVFDSILSPLDKSLASNIPFLPDLTTEEITDKEGDTGTYAYLKIMAQEVINFLSNPAYVILKGCYIIFWLFDNVVYGLFLVERFFFLTILKVLGPIVICLSIFDKFRDLLKKWFILYTGFYLLAIPYFLVILITNEMMEHFYDQLVDNNLQYVPGIANLYIAVIAGISLFLKYRLFKKSTEIVYKLFT